MTLRPKAMTPHLIYSGECTKDNYGGEYGRTAGRIFILAVQCLIDNYAWLSSLIGLLSGDPALDATSLLPPSTLSPAEKRMRVLQFIARLGQPFGALLLTATRQNMEEYRRVDAQ